MSLFSALDGRMVFAVPKKGRLNEATLKLLAESDIQFHRHSRTDIALVKNLNLALVFLPAADIPLYVGEGSVSLGITGADVVAEHEAETPSTETTGAEEIMKLSFGRCQLQVQTPEKGTLTEPKSLIGKRILTSFTHLTRQYFAKLEAEHGTKDAKLQTRIEHVNGSVEAACALGRADGIVDLVESGETMRAAGLRAIDTVVASSAVLIRSKQPSDPELVNKIANRIRGVVIAQEYVMCVYNIRATNLEAAKKVTAGKRMPTVSNMMDSDWLAVNWMVLRAHVATTMDNLSDVGAEDIIITEIKNSRNA